MGGWEGHRGTGERQSNAYPAWNGPVHTVEQAESQQEAVKRVPEVFTYKRTINKDVGIGEPQGQCKKQKLSAVLLPPWAQRVKGVVVVTQTEKGLEMSREGYLKRSRDLQWKGQQPKEASQEGGGE